MPAVLFVTQFRPSTHGHGGDHRALQLLELCREASDEVELVPAESQHRALRRLASGLSFSLRPGVLRPRSLRQTAITGAEYQAVRERARRGLTVVCERTVSQAAFLAGIDAGARVIAVPANIEALAAGAPGREAGVLLDREVKLLSRASAIFCIAREEQWLLRGLGVPAEYLPYYPPRAMAAELERIRSARPARRRELVLVLGTAANPPTMAGMQELLTWLRRGGALDRHRVEVAGFGTERLANDAPGAVVHGAVTQEKLESLLAEARLVVAHQRSGAGALTRIPELLVAGVPVAANGVAARSTLGYEGVHVYDGPEELAALLDRDVRDPAPLARPSAAEARFIGAVRGA